MSKQVLYTIFGTIKYIVACESRGFVLKKKKVRILTHLRETHLVHIGIKAWLRTFVFWQAVP
ncbi:hypothetical protein D3Z46_15790 [Bacteroides sartorii]|nr:hypothetical protein [Phocaeicola sartorii]